MTIEAFGRDLLATGDLDPVYLAINGAHLPERTLHRLCVSYWAFYHLGAAARMAEAKSDKQYWDLMVEAARYSPVSAAHNAQPWPRGAERRHFRGEQSTKAVIELVSKYKTPTDAVMGLVGSSLAGKRTFKSVSQSAREHRGFGEWIAFKIADMAERVLGLPVDFSDCELGIYKDPRQGAAVSYVEHSAPSRLLTWTAMPWEYPITDDQLKAEVKRGVDYFRAFKCLGLTHRKVGVQEVETIFCKYKSHLKGHYPRGKDTREVCHGLEGWGDLAQQLRAHLPGKNGEV